MDDLPLVSLTTKNFIISYEEADDFDCPAKGLRYSVFSTDLNEAAEVVGSYFSFGESKKKKKSSRQDHEKALKRFT